MNLAQKVNALPFSCEHCGRPFEGRSNRRYCGQQCTRGAEYARKKLRKLMDRLPLVVRAEREATAEGNAIEIAWCRGEKQRLTLEIDRRIDEMLKTPRQTSDTIRAQLGELIEKLSELTGETQ